MRTTIAKLGQSMGFGSGPRDRWQIGRYFVQTSFSRRISAVPPPQPIRVALGPDRHRVVISDPGELAALGHIFADVEYAVTGDPKTIFDLGANVGFATLYFSRMFPDARIFSVEADPRTFRRLCENVATLPSVTPLNYAVTGADGPVSFHSDRHSLWSGLTPQSEDTVEVEIEGITIESLMAHVNVPRLDLLKLDVEGAEFDVLRSEALGSIDEIVAEIHYDLATGATEADLRRELDGYAVTFTPQADRGRAFLYARRR